MRKDDIVFFDTETAGLHSVPVIIQYAEGDGEVVIYNFWTNTVRHSMELIEWLCYKNLCGFNMVFDLFHINKFYNMLKLFVDRGGDPNAYPEDHIEELALLEADARDGVCLKPKGALDLFLHARKGPYQSMMDRKDIRIKRVPTAIAYEMAKELEKRVPLKDIYFARKAHKDSDKWQVEDIVDDDGLSNPDFKNIVLRFAPTTALKALATDALGLQESEVLRFTDVEVDRQFWPEEYGFAPFATAIGSPRDWKGTWPEKIGAHIEHWNYNAPARGYAKNDVVYLQRLYDYFEQPEINDDNSVLACMIAAMRWKGYSVDIEKIKKLRLKALDLSERAPKAPEYVKKYIWPDLSETERLVINSTKKVVLEEIAKWTNEDGTPHKAAIKSQEVLDARMAAKEVELYDKLLVAGRLHASFKVIGALSGRMSGADDLNAQGIKNTTEVRSCFSLAPEGMTLSGGDFESFEVAIGVAYYDDPGLYAELAKGKKIHALFGEELFPEETYESILATKGTEDDKYKKAKSALFAMGMYGGTGHTVKERLGIDEKIGDAAKERWAKRFPGIGKRQQEINNLLCTMRQPGGIGSVVEWHEPTDCVKSMLGFPRYFTLENSICKALFQLGGNPPKQWLQYKIKVVRRDREQTASGAARSACFAAAFAIQSANLRAANNHVIQSTGAEITKHIQRIVCDMQPTGIHPWVVMPMNVHDELMVPVIPEKVDELEAVIQKAVTEFKPIIPLIAIDWTRNLQNWSEK
jgi:hypothetical protein